LGNACKKGERIMKKYLTITVSLAFLVTCSIEVGNNLKTLLNQKEGGVLYVETNKSNKTATSQQDLIEFDYTIDELPNAGS
jgi:hypothetical protein